MYGCMRACMSMKSHVQTKNVFCTYAYAFNKYYKEGKYNLYWLPHSLRYHDIKYNTDPIIKGKGSAIFIHLAKKNFSPTSGCIALKKKCILEILEKLNITDKIKIISD